MNNVAGVGKDAPTVVNEQGGKQSKVLYRFDLLDPKAMFKMTEVLKQGAEKYGDNNWHNIPVHEHINHMLIHTYAYLAGDTSDDHLSHIMCRAMFAQAVDIMDMCKDEPKDGPTQDPNVLLCGGVQGIITTGTPPLTITSTTAVSNLNVGMLDQGSEKTDLTGVVFNVPGFTINCGICRCVMYIPGSGIHKCDHCGMGHKVTINNGSIYIDPYDEK